MGLISKYLLEVYALSGVVVRANDFRKDLRLVGYSYRHRRDQIEASRFTAAIFIMRNVKVNP